ncbi:hypothetical protein ACRPK1_08480 [Lactobacillus johnsonii]|uniref:hypothetical protein n=1 Tax=Lactobacillus johnsonii TaxID=33959 RepID=UPI003D77A3B1
MRKRDKLKKKQAKMTINQLQKQYRKGAQRAMSNGTITALLNLGVLYTMSRLEMQIETAQINFIARKYKERN